MLTVDPMMYTRLSVYSLSVFYFLVLQRESGKSNVYLLTPPPPPFFCISLDSFLCNVEGGLVTYRIPYDSLWALVDARICFITSISASCTTREHASEPSTEQDCS